MTDRLTELLLKGQTNPMTELTAQAADAFVARYVKRLRGGR